MTHREEKTFATWKRQQYETEAQRLDVGPEVTLMQSKARNVVNHQKLKQARHRYSPASSGSTVALLIP